MLTRFITKFFFKIGKIGFYRFQRFFVFYIHHLLSFNQRFSKSFLLFCVLSCSQSSLRFSKFCESIKKLPILLTVMLPFLLKFVL